MTQKSHSQNEFMELLRLHRSRVFGYILSMVRNSADAEDLFQETCLVLWDKFSEYESEKSFPAWACKIAQYQTLNFIRSSKRSKLYFCEELLTELAEVKSARCDLPHDDYQSALQDCMDKLNEQDRHLVKECYGDRFSIKHVASQIGRPVGAVYKSLNRIRKVLLNCITRTVTSEERSP